MGLKVSIRTMGPTIKLWVLLKIRFIPLLISSSVSITPVFLLDAALLMDVLLQEILTKFTRYKNFQCQMMSTEVGWL